MGATVSTTCTSLYFATNCSHNLCKSSNETKKARSSRGRHRWNFHYKRVGASCCVKRTDSHRANGESSLAVRGVTRTKREKNAAYFLHGWRMYGTTNVRSSND